MIPHPPALEVRDPSTGDLLGFIALDSAIAGRARGGLRMVPDLSADEIEKLARAMTLKYGFLGLPQGGGKAGLFGDPEAPGEHRSALLHRFALAAAPLLRSRRYIPDSDMGTCGSDIQAMLQSIGIRSAPREYRGSLSGHYTAATVHASAVAGAAAHGLDWPSCRVSIEGFGKVGAPLAEMCAFSGAAVVSVSNRYGAIYQEGGLEIGKLLDFARLAPSRALELYRAACPLAVAVTHADLLQVPADIFCPCARHDTLHAANAARLAARVVSCGANSPVTPEAEIILGQRGVLVIPDFVANSGGVLGGTMEFAGWRRDEILSFCGTAFLARVTALLADAPTPGPGLRAFAEAHARSRFEAVKASAERGSLRGRLSGAGLAAYREGWIPGRVVRHLSEGYFRASLG